MAERTIVLISNDRVLKTFPDVDGVCRPVGYRAESVSGTEIAALSHLSRFSPDLIPHVYWLGENSTSCEKVDIGNPNQFPQIVDLLERVQAVPIEEASLPVARPDDYFREAKSKLDDLASNGSFLGITKQERDEITTKYESGLSSLEIFDSVFVHGDFQNRHIGDKGDQPLLIDWEQARIGSPLEDPVFYALRHPTRGRLIKDYLRRKYSSNPLERVALPTAYETMEIDRLIHIWHWNTFKRSGLVAAAKSVYARAAIGMHLQ